jgi:hypothetical protein
VSVIKSFMRLMLSIGKITSSTIPIETKLYRDEVKS